MPKLNTNITRQSGTYIQFRYYGLKYKSCFFPYFSVLWSKQKSSLRCEPDIDVFKTYLKEIYKTKKQRHYNYGNKLANSLLCRLGVGRSMLKSHGFAINLSSTDRCFCAEIDDIKHFFVFYFIWQVERQDLFLKLNQIIPNFSQISVKNQCEILLHGISLNSLCPDPRNNKIVFEVQKFISKTNCFSKHYD